MVRRQPPPADDALRLKSGTATSNGGAAAAGYNSFGFAPPTPPTPLGRREEQLPSSNDDGERTSLVHEDGDSSISGIVSGSGTVDGGGGSGGGSGGDGSSGRRRDEGGGGGGEHTVVTAGLVVWAAGASLVAAFLAANRGFVDTASATATTTATTAATTKESAAFAASTNPAFGSSKARSSSDPKLDGGGIGSSSKSWCLPNAAHQNFTGIVLKEDDGILPNGKWEGQHWWYHDEITSGFHMVATFGEETYGFWDLGIIGAAGNTEYVAAYKGGECLFYQEEVQPGSTPFDEDVTCRGSAWAGNVTLQEEVGFGYGTKAERWAGVIREDKDTGYGGLPPGTESLIDLQRNPDNDGEVRLLYHRVIAPTEGVMRWAGGDSVAFDLVFTGLEKMTDADVLDLVKVPGICEVMAGEFHDQQARGNTGPGGVRGRARARSRALRGDTTKPEKWRGGTSATPSSLAPGTAASRESENKAGEKKGAESGARAATGLARAAAGGESSDPIVIRAAAAAAAAAAIVPPTVPTRKREESGVEALAGDWNTGVAGGSGENLSSPDVTREGGGPRRLVGGARADADSDAPADIDGREEARKNEESETEPAASGPGLLPIHHLMRSLGRKGYRRRG